MAVVGDRFLVEQSHVVAAVVVAAVVVRVAAQLARTLVVPLHVVVLKLFSRSKMSSNRFRHLGT